MSKNSIVKSGGNVLAELNPINDLVVTISDVVTTWKRENEITNRVDIQARAYVEGEREKTKRIIGEKDTELKKFLAGLEAELRKDSMKLEKFKYEYNLKSEETKQDFAIAKDALNLKKEIVRGLLDTLNTNNNNLTKGQEFLEFHTIIMTKLIKCV